MDTLYDKLKEYSKSDYYGFHMPGHKRNSALLENSLPYEVDITEIEGFDDLHHASGILKAAQERAAQVYGAKETHFLVNGSTAGILAAILGNTRKGDTVLVARNCHKSVYHAIYMNELKPVYLYPGFSEEFQLNTEVSVSAVKAALKAHSDISAVIIVSPTYDGVISDIEGIAEAVHESGIPLIVDEAHGAHFGFHPYFSRNANQRGADVVIHSVHKTLPSMTQTALLHINGGYANAGGVRKYLDMLQSSSPSYLLMASIDACVCALKENRDQMFEPYVQILKDTRERLGCLKRIHLAEMPHYDKSKLVLSVKDADIGSMELYRILLNDYHLQMEMVAGTYVLAMTSVGDTKEGLCRLGAALEEIDASIDNRMRGLPNQITAEYKRERNFHLPEARQRYSSAEIAALTDERLTHSGGGKAVEYVKWSDGVGRISTEYAYLYPPGCPLLVPGEQITAEAAAMLHQYERAHFTIEGLAKEGYIGVWING